MRRLRHKGDAVRRTRAADSAPQATIGQFRKQHRMTNDRSSDDMLREVQQWLAEEREVEPPPRTADQPPEAPEPMVADPIPTVARPATTLQIGNTTSIENPTDAQIAEALAGADEFAILLKSDLVYMQAAPLNPPQRGLSRNRRDPTPLPPGEFHLEHQDGSLDEHYQVESGSVTFDQVVAAFQSYARGDDAWRTAFSWSKMDLG